MDPLRCTVKAAAVANLTDARYFAAFGVNYLGFALEPGASGFSLTEVAAVREWIEGPLVVGEFGHVDAEQIALVAEELRLDVVQVGPFGKTRHTATVTGLPVVQELVLGGDLSPELASRILESDGGALKALVANATAGGLAWSALRQNEPWLEWLSEAATHVPVLLDVSAANESEIAEILALPHLAGVQLRGGDEEAVGVKSFDELDQWWDALRVEEY